jgi:hypothetical protein
MTDIYEKDPTDLTQEEIQEIRDIIRKTVLAISVEQDKDGNMIIDMVTE